MARLHQLPASDFSFLRDHGLGGVSEQLGVVRRTFDRARRDREFPVLEQAWQWLVANAPTDRADALAWGDARCTNMIFSGTRCTGILDWDMVSLAGPESDLAWWLVYDRGCVGTGQRLPGILTPAETITLWEETAGRKVLDLEYWLVFNLFWLGAIMIRLVDFVAENGTPAPALAERVEFNPAMSILHSRFGTGVDLGLGAWADFRPIL